MKNTKKGFTLVEMLVVLSIIGTIASAVFPSFTNVRSAGRDTVRISDIQQLALAMEVSRDIFSDDYATLTNTTPQAIGTELPEVPENNSENGGVYGWINNTSDPSQYCAWAVLERDVYGSFYVATPRGAGYVDEEPTDFDSCAFYEEDSFDTGTEDNDKKEFVCHYGKKGWKTLNVGKGAVQSHLNHGDSLGACEDGQTGGGGFGS